MTFRSKWIKYSADDASATWHLREALAEGLKGTPWLIDDER